MSGPEVDRPAILLIGLDGFPHGRIDARSTPTLHQLARAGGIAPDGGRSPLPSTTYPGFASLLTGAWPEVHRVRTTFAREGAVPGWAGERTVQVPTLLERCAEAGLRTGVMMGDQKLYGVLRAGDPAAPWPEGGRLADDAPRDSHGYLANEAAWPPMAAMLADEAGSPGFWFLHLNEADSVGHDHGPASEEATAAYEATDRIVGRILSAIRSRWARWLVVVVSDHDMETRSRPDGIVPLDLPGVRGIADDWMGDGGAAWLRLRPDVETERIAAVLADLPEVHTWARHGDRVLIGAHAGVAWHDGPIPIPGIHGGPTARSTVTIVGGGHPLVYPLARSIEQRRPELRDWAPTFAAILGVSLPDSDGHDLLSA